MTGEKVTVIGLGSMGAAIAGALVAKGFRVTVWNRDTSKAAPLIERGAVLVTDLSAAIAASPLLVICVSDYKITRSILHTADAAVLRGRTVVQLSTGTPKEAGEFDAWVQQQGGTSLNGDIMSWPRQIGTSEATITIAGASASFKQYEATLQALAGTVDHVGEEAGASAVLFNAVMAYLAGNWVGFCHGALICENAGLRPDAFGTLIANISPILATESIHMGKVIQEGRFNEPESTINTTAIDLHLLVQHSKEAGISADLPVFAANLFQRAVDAGYGGEEHAAIIKVMRKSAI
ncbi:NAD(P)-binding domain-containing protein [Chitinophaga niabensis]|uniref:NAD(P)-dependent oxidoreductase n=1 Tax=Chitinophaga niabensis TaxID=536979 RepID=UPI0031B9E64E